MRCRVTPADRLTVASAIRGNPCQLRRAGSDYRASRQHALISIKADDAVPSQGGFATGKRDGVTRTLLGARPAFDPAVTLRSPGRLQAARSMQLGRPSLNRGDTFA